MAITMSATQTVEDIIVQFNGLPADKSYSYDLYSIDEDDVRVLEVPGGTDEDVYFKKSNYSGTLRFEADVYNAASTVVANLKTQITIVDLVEVRTATKGTTLNFNLGIFDATVQSQAAKYVVQFTDASGNPIGKAVTAKISGDTATATSNVKLDGDVHYTITAVNSAKENVKSYSDNSTAIDGIAPKAGKLALTQTSQNEVYVTVSGFSDNVGVTQYRYSFNKNGDFQVLPSDSVITVDGTVGAKVTVYVTAFDAAGNASKIVSKSIKIKDVTKPICVAGMIADADARVTTKGTTLTFAESNFTDNVQVKKYTVTFYSDAAYTAQVGKAITVSAKKGVVSATSKTQFGDMVYYKVIATDAAKNNSDAIFGQVKAVDGVAPKAGKVALSQFSQSQVSVALTGFSDNKGITEYQYSFSKNDGYQTLSGTESVIDVSTAPNKSVTVYVRALDAAGNVSKVVSKSLKIKDVTKPICVAGMIADADARVTTKGTTLSFAESDFTDNVQVKKYTVTFYSDAAYTAQVGKAITVSAKKGVVSATCKTQFGDMVYYKVIATDAAKNNSDTIYGKVVAVDGVAPKAGKVALTQFSQDQVTVSVNGFSDNKGIVEYQYSFSKNGEYKALAGEVSTITVTTAPNQNVTVYVRALDAAGNVSKVVSKSLKIKDVTAPDKVEGIAIAGVSEKNVTTFTWSIPYDNVGVTRYNVLIDGVAYSTKKNTLNVKNLLDGEHTVVVSAQDKAGNVGDAGSATLTKGEVASADPTPSGEQISSGEQKSIVEQSSSTGETTSGDQKLIESGKEFTIGQTGAAYTQTNLPDVSDVTGTAYADKVTVAPNSFAHVEKVELGAGDDQLVIGDGACVKIDDLDFGDGNDQLTIGSGSTVWLNAESVDSLQITAGNGSTLYFAGALYNYARQYYGALDVQEWELSDGGLSQTQDGDDPFDQQLASR